MNIPLDIESERLLAVYLEYVPTSAPHAAGIVHDALLTGLLSKWADTAATVPIDDLLRAEVLRVVGAGAQILAVDLTPRAPDDPRAAAERKAGDLAAAWGVDPAAVYLAAARVGLAKFYATIQIQKAAS